MKYNLLLCFLIFSFAYSQSHADWDYADTVDMAWLNKQYGRSVSDQTGHKNSLFEGFSSMDLQEKFKKLDQTTPFPVEHNATTERFIRVMLRDQQDRLKNVNQRSKYYFPIFEQILDQHNLPLELKYLSVVESALIAQAHSSVGAKGLWQFMLGTAKQYGLKVNSLVDDRFDAYASTKAACLYLSDLYEIFGDWNLALAAYNAGPGNVTKAIRRAGGNKNYWEIRNFLPEETRGYVPAFYATLYIFESLGLDFAETDSPGLSFAETDTLRVSKTLEIDELSGKLNMEISFLSSINPQYTKNTIPEDHVLTLPKGKIGVYLRLEQDGFGENKVAGTQNKTTITPYNSHLVEPGENLLKIAGMYKISMDDLKKWNGLVTNYVMVGQSLVVRKNDEIDQSPSKHRNERIQPNNKTNKESTTYVVQEGDSLFKISRLFPDVTISQIRTWNNIWGVNYVKPGTKLLIFKS